MKVNYQALEAASAVHDQAAELLERAKSIRDEAETLESGEEKDRMNKLARDLATRARDLAKIGSQFVKG